MRRAKSGCFASQGSQGGTVEIGICDWAEATTLWADGMTAGSGQ